MFFEAFLFALLGDVNVSEDLKSGKKKKMWGGARRKEKNAGSKSLKKKDPHFFPENDTPD